MEPLKLLFEKLRKLPKGVWLRLFVALLTTTGISIPLLDEEVSERLIRLLPIETVQPVPIDSVWLSPPHVDDEAEPVWKTSDQVPVYPKKPAQQIQKKTKQARVGAICKDGTWSKSTGQGACSRHGGVAEWVYEEEKAEQTVSQQTYRYYQPPPNGAQEPSTTPVDFMQFAAWVLVALILILLIKKALN